MAKDRRLWAQAFHSAADDFIHAVDSRGILGPIAADNAAKRMMLAARREAGISELCWQCGGSTFMHLKISMADGRRVMRTIPCEECEGTGEVRVTNPDPWDATDDI